MVRRGFLQGLLVLLAACGGRVRENPALFEDGRRYHLRSGEEPEWREFAPYAPHGKSLELKFPATPNAGEATLLLWQQDVKWEWDLKLNGKRLRRLEQQPDPLVLAVPLPAGALREGENVLEVAAPRNPEDIRVGPFRIDPRPVADALGEASLDVQVVDPSDSAPLPCRITVTDDAGSLAAFHPAEGQRLAVRPGVIYTGDGRARFTVAAGKYVLHATRGFEYGLDTQRIALKPGDRRAVVLRIRREVETPNWAACDTHVHTREKSGHGDATLDERMLTLAGEGVELPVATEHDQHADYAPSAARTGAARHFTPVPGNECTTKKGHFNVFPVAAGAPVPDSKQEDWPTLMRSLRGTPGVRVVILNHPRGLHSNFIPFGPGNFNPVTGENLRGFPFTFDAMELVNSGAMRSDPMQLYRDWFALLNHGYRVTGVGSSDCHDVNNYIVGQGRTYLPLRDGDPSKLDVGAACEAILKGRVSVSLGLLAAVQVDGKFGMGDLATGLGEQFEVAISVHGPAWTQADRVSVWLNGAKAREEKLPLSGGAGEKARLSWRFPRPANDAHLVVIASGPGVKGPWWPLARPYQPESIDFEPRVMASTNPVWIDADGDGAFTAPRAVAQALVTPRELGRVLELLAPHDEAVAAQAASLLHAAGRDLRTTGAAALIGRAAPAVQRGFAAFLATVK